MLIGGMPTHVPTQIQDYMLLIRQINRRDIQLEYLDTDVDLAVTKVLNLISDIILTSIFTHNHDRRRFTILQANCLYVEKIDTGNEEYKYCLIFARNDRGGGVFVNTATTEQLFLVKHMITIEYEDGGVLFGMEIDSNELFPINNDAIRPQVEKYIDDMVRQNCSFTDAV